MCIHVLSIAIIIFGWVYRRLDLYVLLIKNPVLCVCVCFLNVKHVHYLSEWEILWMKSAFINARFLEFDFNSKWSKCWRNETGYETTHDDFFFCYHTQHWNKLLYMNWNWLGLLMISLVYWSAVEGK